MRDKVAATPVTKPINVFTLLSINESWLLLFTLGKSNKSGADAASEKQLWLSSLFMITMGVEIGISGGGVCAKYDIVLYVKINLNKFAEVNYLCRYT